MTPGARVAAAMEVLADMDRGQAAEQALTRWGRSHRFAGSKDRAAIRDHIFDLLRMRATAAHFGRGEAPRALMIGLLHAQQAPLDDLFSGIGHAPDTLTASERDFPEKPADKEALFNLPAWIIPKVEESLGAHAPEVAAVLQSRAPVILRVNLARMDRAAAQAQLLEEGIETAVNRRADSALSVLSGARKIRQSKMFLDGLVELQDASSQAAVQQVPPGGRVLDYCAGGGGKALALAMVPTRQVFAHDADAGRMADLPVRAKRAGVSIPILSAASVDVQAPFDVVFCDVPCSGSGAWRRAPEGKWTLTAERLTALTESQDRILTRAAGLVEEGGHLFYATCSILRDENRARVDAFLDRSPEWRLAREVQFLPDAEGDGFFAAHLTRKQR